MQIDRALFLALCGTIAAGGGCRPTAQSTVVPTFDVPAPARAPASAAPSTDAPPDPLTCDDSVGTAPSCESLTSSSPNCDPADFPQAQCYAFSPFLKPKLAEQFVKCLLALSPADMCGVMGTYKCEREALSAACPDAVASAYCATEHDPNTELELVNQCTKLDAGMTEEARQRFSACVDFSCIEGMTMGE